MSKLTAYRKGIASVIAALTVIGSSSVLHGTSQLWVNVSASALGAVLVVWVDNE